MNLDLCEYQSMAGNCLTAGDGVLRWSLRELQATVPYARKKERRRGWRYTKLFSGLVDPEGI